MLKGLETNKQFFSDQKTFNRSNITLNRFFNIPTMISELSLFSVIENHFAYRHLKFFFSLSPAFINRTIDSIGPFLFRYRSGAASTNSTLVS